MKTNQKLEVLPQAGLYIGIPAPKESANRLVNWKYDAKTRAWTNNLGFEKFFSNQTNFGPFGGSAQRAVDSVYCFQQHNGARQSFLYESNGTLYVLNPSDAGGAGSLITLKTDRQTPSPTQPHTSYEPYGRYCIITNGLDGPLKFKGSTQSSALYDLGWRQQPGTPTVRSVGQPDGQPITFLDATDATFNDQIWKGSDTTFRGVSSGTATEVVRYRYKVSFVNEAGSESPLSQDSNEMSITAVSVTRGGTSGVPKTGLILDIPRGPNGTLARRIYRTKTDSNTFFFVTQLNNNSDESFTDFIADTELGANAPEPSSSVLMPSPACRFSATFKNVLFIDGGEMDPSRIYYSQPLQPDTFAASSYFEVGTREGGDITGLAPYYNSLLVFRENAIDLIRGDSVNGFNLVPFIQGVGTLSPHTIVPIPNLGLSFMSQDGIYLIKGGLDGGADLTLKKISQGLQEYFERASRDKLPAAIGVFSQRERELHYYMCIDGQTFLNLGLVYHVDAQQWSERQDFPFKTATTDKDGNIIGGYDLNNVFSGSPSGTLDAPAKGGLFIVSGQRTSGYLFTGSGLNIKTAKVPNSLFRSAWLDFGMPQIKKYPKYVYLYVLSRGDNEVSMSVYKDRDWGEELPVTGMKMQRGDHQDQPVYDSVLYTWDKEKWQDKLLTQIRYDVATAGAVSEFAFELNTTSPMEFIGYSVEYQVDAKKTIRGKV
tara:strand:- start:1521 stop:3653 length:2133 start_codon:yes stop_codon:yes gene_type:complete